MDQMAKFGVLGSGEVGQALAEGLRDIGHEVRIGSRDPRKLTAYSAETKIPNGTFAEVAKWGDALYWRCWEAPRRTCSGRWAWNISLGSW
jgi:ketol-acid reductoisomerase